jgi:raffinose/stachyose/melibiose transport system permease protein
MIRKAGREREITYLCFVLPTLALYVLFFIEPVIMGCYYSLTNWSGISSSPKFIGFQNYIKLATDKVFLSALKFNGVYSLLLVVIIVVLSLVLALCLNAEIRGRSFFRGAMFFPAVLSMLTVGMVFNEIFTYALPNLGALLGIEALQTNVLSNVNTAMYGVLFVNVWQGLAIPTILLLAGLQTIPQEMFEAAELDGAGKMKQFFSITLPFLLPVLSVVLILTLKDGLTVFDYIKALTEGGPAGRTKSLTFNIYNLGFKELKFSYAIAQAMVVTAIVVVISYFQIRVVDRKKVY